MRPPLATPEELKLRLANNATPPTPTMSTSQVRNGPNGNFVVFERSNGVPLRASSQSPSSNLRHSPLSPNISHRPLPQSPPQERHEENAYGHTGHIYSQVQPQSNLYGLAKPPPPAYSHAPPYRAKDTAQLPPLQLTSPPPSSPQKSRSTPKQVHFAATPRSSDRSSPQKRESPGFRSGSSDGGSTVSGPSSIDSSLYDDTLMVIEKSNQDLEQRLAVRQQADKSQRRTPPTIRIDTIHNNRHLDQEIIFEEGSDLSRSSSVSTLKPDYHPLPDHPSLADMGSIADLSAKFQSLTARKLMAGLSISSIDTLLEVNAANDGHKLSILNESTETIDFGVI